MGFKWQIVYDVVVDVVVVDVVVANIGFVVVDVVGYEKTGTRKAPIDEMARRGGVLGWPLGSPKTIELSRA